MPNEHDRVDLLVRGNKDHLPCLQEEDKVSDREQDRVESFEDSNGHRRIGNR